MENPLVSIITPTFNSGRFIAQTIQSVQKQTHQQWEMIIVDDCSIDETVSIIDAIANNDGRIQLFKLSKNSGTGVARNTALARANGKFIAFLDADDLWKPEKLRKQLEFMKVNNLPFTFSFYDCINEAGEPLNKRIEAPLNLSYTKLFFCNYVGNLTGIYNANYYGKIDISAIRKRQDWMMWLTILKKIKFAQPVPESLAFYRVRENSISASKLDLINHNFSVYRTHHRLHLTRATLCMIGFLFTQLILKPRYSKTIKASI